MSTRPGLFSVVWNDIPDTPMPSSLLPQALLTASVNIFRASLHSQGFAAFTENLDEWKSYLLQVLQSLMLSVRDVAFMALAEEIYACPNVQVLREKLTGLTNKESALPVMCVLELHGQ